MTSQTTTKPIVSVLAGTVSIVAVGHMLELYETYSRESLVTKS